MFSYQPDNPQLLADRVILISGAGQGIGAAAARCFARYGATTILLGRTVKHLENVYDDIESDGSPQPAIFPLNLESAAPADYASLQEVLSENFGRIDGVLHNAAILGDLTPIEQYSPETWQRVMQTNVNGSFQLSRSLIPLLRAAKDPSMVFTGSSVGRKGRASWGAYAVSKFAVEGLMQVLASELDESEHPVRVNLINPGGTRTRMRRSAFPGETAEETPTAAEIMPLYLYLMGPDSRGISGRSLDAQGNDSPQTLQTHHGETEK